METKDIFRGGNQKVIVNDLFIIVSHTRFNDKGEAVHGTASELTPYLEKKKKSYIYIQHSLFSGNATQIIVSKAGKKSIRKRGFIFLPVPIRIFQEYVITILVLFRYATEEGIYIGVDPLNAFLGIILRKIGKIKKVIFYTADYAEKRYPNAFMNEIYHWFDKFGIRNADQIWNVSSRITTLRKRQGVAKDRNFFVPNAPALKSQRMSNSTVEPHTLVIVTHITKTIDFESIITAVKKLKKKYRDIKLFIIGNGDYREDLERFVSSLKLTNSIVFTGSKTHKEVMEVLSKSGIGLAVYTDDFPWTRYGDSMKAREYLACGLPVIITDVPSTANDIKKAHAGIVIKSSKEIESAIEALFKNKKSYEKMRINARNLAKKHDFAKSMDATNFFI
jgi:glycosyltransferase involved in cell wall biosynthesis